MSCRRSSRFWGLGCPKIFHEIEDSLGPQTHRGKYRFDRVRRPDVLPVRRRKIVERQQRFLVFHQALHGLRVLGLEAPHTAIEGLVGTLSGLGHPDLVQRRLDLRLYRLRHLVQHVGRLVHPATLLSRLGPFLGKCLPEPQCTITNRQLRRDRQSLTLQLLDDLQPAGLGLPVAIDHCQHFLAARVVRAHDHQQAEPIIHADVAVDPVGPHVHVAPPTQIPLAPLPVVRLPALLQAADRGRRQPGGSFTQQCLQCGLHLPGRDPLQVQPGDELLDVLRPLQIRRHQLAVELDATVRTVSDLWHLDRHLTQPGLDTALR